MLRSRIARRDGDKYCKNMSTLRRTLTHSLTRGLAAPYCPSHAAEIVTTGKSVQTPPQVESMHFIRRSPAAIDTSCHERHCGGTRKQRKLACRNCEESINTIKKQASADTLLGRRNNEQNFNWRNTCHFHVSPIKRSSCGLLRD